EHTIRRNWAIRHQESGLIGSIGLLFLDGLNSHRNEFGYWLGKPFWNQGMMTRVIDVFSRYCMAQFKYKRLQATVDPRNPASARILEKNGFSYEGTLKNYNLKKGQLLDVMMYAIYHQ
ncbi:MAG: GNAT family N-acetyltransferase, partial [Calditrichaeota bacterium]|nr:GNAT family N-acetyltransferase [Calditrichota bacterium]